MVNTVTIALQDSMGTPLGVTFYRMRADDHPNIQATMCRMVHGGFTEILFLKRELETISPSDMYDIAERMVSEEVEKWGLGSLFLDSGYTIHTGAEPATGA